jgi:MFS family permease
MSEFPPLPAFSETAGTPTARTQWRQLWLLFTLEFIVAIGFGVIYPYLPVFLHDVGGAQPWLIGLVAAAVFVAMFLFSGPFGRLCDRVGRKPVLMAGSVGITVTLLLFLTTTDPWWFIVFRFLEGLSAAAAVPAINALVADLTADDERSRAFGWVTTAQTGGFILGPAVAVPIYTLAGGGTTGFRAIFLVGAIVTAVVTIVLAVSLREPARSRARLRAGSHEKPPRSRELATPPVAMLILVAATANFATGGFEVLWSIWLKELGASLAFIGLTWIAISAPLLLAFVFGRLADRSNKYVLIVTGYGMAGVCWVVYGATHALAVFLVFNVIEGLAWAWAYPAKESFLVQISPQRWIGAVQGLQQSAIQLAALVGTIIAPILYGGVSWGEHQLGPFQLPAVHFSGIGGYALSIDGLLALAGVAIAAPVLRRGWGGGGGGGGGARPPPPRRHRPELARPRVAVRPDGRHRHGCRRRLARRRSTTTVASAARSTAITAGSIRSTHSGAVNVQASQCTLACWRFCTMKASRPSASRPSRNGTAPRRSVVADDVRSCGGGTGAPGRAASPRCSMSSAMWRVSLRRTAFPRGACVYQYRRRASSASR